MSYINLDFGALDSILERARIRKTDDDEHIIPVLIASYSVAVTFVEM